VTEEPHDHGERLRERALRALHVYFANRRWPRLMMSGILLITGGAGFLASFCLLKLGMTQMWIRYPLAVLLAWVVLLGLLRLWATIERRCFQPDEDLSAVLEDEEASPRRRVLRDSERSSWDWSWDFGWPGIDCDEGCLPGVFLAIVLALLAAVLAVAVGVVMGAPLLIAEVFLDAILVAALFKKVRGLEPRWWLASAIRKTAAPVFLTALSPHDWRSDLPGVGSARAIDWPSVANLERQLFVTRRSAV